MPDLPQTLEQILAAAAADPELRQALLDDRLKAVAALGVSLCPTEQAALEAVPRDQLELILSRVPEQPPPTEEVLHVECTGIRPDEVVRRRRSGRLVAAAATAVVIGGAGIGLMCLTAGSRPDDPEMTQPVVQTDAGPEAPGDGGPDTK